MKLSVLTCSFGLELGFGSWSLNLDLCLGLDMDLGLVLDLDTAAGMGLGMATQTWTPNPGVLELTCRLQSDLGLWGLGVGLRVKSQNSGGRTQSPMQHCESNIESGYQVAT